MTVLSTGMDEWVDMKLMEVIEDGSKIQIVLEDVSMEDVDAIHSYQLAGGEGTLTISDGITFRP